MKMIRKRLKLLLVSMMVVVNLTVVSVDSATLVVDDGDGLLNEILNASDGDIIEITKNVILSGTIDINKDITIQSSEGNNFTIFKETGGKHFNINATLTLSNITLDGKETGGGVTLNRNGHLIMETGSIMQNCSALNSSGGAVYAYAFGTNLVTTLTMKSGSAIRNCTAKFYGGGIYAGLNAHINMEGGEISQCRASDGGGIYVSYSNTSPTSADVAINGGEIKNCEAKFGGGILIQNTVRITAMDASVIGNYAATYGGGIAILVGDVSKFNTGLVSGNSALLTDGDWEQIYMLDAHSPQNGEFYTLIDYKSGGVSPELLNGEKHGLGFFKVYNNKTREYLVAFCGELETSVSATNYYVNYFLPNVRLNQEQVDKIAITVGVALKGNMSYNDVTNDTKLCDRAYVAQYMIWNIESGYYDSEILSTTKERIETALGENGAKCIEEIVNELKKYEDKNLPSFAGDTWENAKFCFLEYDDAGGKYTVTLTDINGVLNYFKINQNSLPQGLEAVIDKDNNTLTITCTDKSVLQDGDVIIELSYVFKGENAMVYFHSMYQDLVIPSGSYEAKTDAYINPSVYEPGPTTSPETTPSPKPMTPSESAPSSEPTTPPKPTPSSEPTVPSKPTPSPKPVVPPKFTPSPKPTAPPKPASNISSSSDLKNQSENPQSGKTQGSSETPKTGDDHTTPYVLLFTSFLGMAVTGGVYYNYRKMKTKSVIKSQRNHRKGRKSD